MNLQKLCNYVSLTTGQLVSILVLVVALESFLNLWILRTEYTTDPNVFIGYWGFPLEAIKVKNIVYKGTQPDIGVVLTMRSFYEPLWGGVTINTLIYIVFSIILVKFISWIHNEIEYRRYYVCS